MQYSAPCEAPNFHAADLAGVSCVQLFRLNTLTPHCRGCSAEGSQKFYILSGKDFTIARLCRFIESGGVYKLAFGPKAFVVVSDPVVVRHLLKVLIDKQQASVLSIIYI